MRITVSKEDYLKAILEAEAEAEPVISATLKKWLSVSAPAVSMALRRLNKDGLVKVGEDGRLRLTAEGRRIARRTAVRHHLIERMLTEMFGMDWTKVHEEAERLEHAVSPEFEARLEAVLGRKDTCPHGNSVEPEGAAARRSRGLRLLSEAEVGGEYAVESIYERDRGLMEFLNRRGVRPGARLKVLQRRYDKTITLKTPAGTTMLGEPAAERVWVAGAAKRRPQRARSSVN